MYAIETERLNKSYGVISKKMSNIRKMHNKDPTEKMSNIRKNIFLISGKLKFFV